MTVERELEKRTPEVIERYANNRPALVFCSSKKSAETTAELLAKRIHAKNKSWSAISNDSTGILNNRLRKTLQQSIGFHHADLANADRNTLERLFKQRSIRVLCCTSTLAMGVNLPAHLVVIKGTIQWQGKGVGYASIDNAHILQMIGRAGRPGYDDHGVAVIMTNDKHRRYYERLANGCDVVESRLLDTLTTTLNAEICNKVIESIDDAATWVRGTFSYTRICQNPQRYGLGGQMNNVEKFGRAERAAVESFLDAKIKTSLQELAKISLCHLDNDGILIRPTKSGQVMSHYMLGLRTMRSILQFDPDVGISGLLCLVAGTEEVQVNIRRGEKKILRELNKQVRFPLPKTQKVDSTEKAYLLLQCVLEKGEIEDAAMCRDSARMTEQACRVLRACVDYALKVKGGRVLLSATLLLRNLSQEIWDDSARVSELHQIKELCKMPALVKNLFTVAKINSIKQAAETLPPVLDAAAGRKAPFGQKIKLSCRRIIAQSLSMKLLCKEAVKDGEKEKLLVKIVPSNPSSYIEHTSDSKMWSEHEHATFTLIAFSKSLVSAPQNTDIESMDSTNYPNSNSVANDVSSKQTQIHLYRKINEPCDIEIPSGTAFNIYSVPSSLFISLVSSIVGLDQHIVYTASINRDVPMTSTRQNRNDDSVVLKKKSTSSTDDRASGSFIEMSKTVTEEENHKKKRPRSIISLQSNATPIITERQLSKCNEQKKTPRSNQERFLYRRNTSNNHSSVGLTNDFGETTYANTADDHHTKSIDDGSLESSISPCHSQLQFTPTVRLGRKEISNKRIFSSCDHLSTLRRKASENQLLSRCKSSRLRAGNESRDKLTTASCLVRSFESTCNDTKSSAVEAYSPAPVTKFVLNTVNRNCTTTEGCNKPAPVPGILQSTDQPNFKHQLKCITTAQTRQQKNKTIYGKTEENTLFVASKKTSTINQDCAEMIGFSSQESVSQQKLDFDVFF